MAGRKIRNERDARRCMEKAKAMGLTHGQWARLHGVDGRSLSAWSNNLSRGAKRRGAGKLTARAKQVSKRRERSKQRAGAGLVELIPAASAAAKRYTVRYGQLIVEVDEQFDAEILARLLRVVVSC